jgi:hypothetical protein
MNIRVSLLMGGLLAIASPLAANAEAVQVFTVQTAQPGIIDFRGLGTATYNNSKGTSNGITLGSTSSLSVNNSLSASKEYTGTTSGLMQLTGESAVNRSNFQQSIGTSAGAANTLSSAESTATQAASSAASSAAKTTASAFGNNYNEYINNFNTKDALSTDAELLDQKDKGTIQGLVEKTAGTGGAADTFKLRAYTEDEWDKAYASSSESTYNSDYATSYSTAAATSSSNSAMTSNSGKVFGDFSTVNKGSSALGTTAAEVKETASSSASAVHGETWLASGETATTVTATTENPVMVNGKSETSGTHTINADGKTESAWEEAFNRDYTAALNALSTGAEDSSVSVVTVEGIGNVTNIGAQDTSTFQVDLMARQPAAEATENGTANGSSSATLSTVSNANVTSSQFASAFIQSFAPNDIPESLLATPAVVLGADGV